VAPEEEAVAAVAAHVQVLTLTRTL
jgi:hypothetical protein